MAYKTITIKEARDNFSEVVEMTAIAGQIFIITKFGKSKAIIAPLSAIGENTIRKTKKQKIVLDETAGVWKDRKYIMDPSAWVRSHRLKQSNRYGKVFD